MAEPMSAYSNLVPTALRRTYCAVVRPSDQSITTATNTQVDFTASATIEEDTDGMFDTTNPDQLTIKRAGYYVISAYTAMEADADGVRSSWIEVGSNILTQIRTAPQSYAVFHSIAAVAKLERGDVIALWVRHAAGSTIALTSGTYTPRLAVAML